MNNLKMMLSGKKETFCFPEVWGGIECTINRVGNTYFDQLAQARFYEHPPIHALTDLGIKKVRFPILWEKHQPQQDTVIDWSWTSSQLNELKKSGVDVIAGLVHHGSGPVYTHLLHPDFPILLANYAKEVATAFPWIEYYTPVNEPLTTARFSGLYGIWYPHACSDETFLLCLLHQLKAVVLAMQEIRKINPHAKLVQTEDLGKTYSTPLLQYQADFENERRWLTYDILCGRLDQKHRLWKYFIKNNIPVSLLLFFKENPCIPDVFGFNHYVTSERFIDERIYLYPEPTHGGNQKHIYADVEVVRVDTDEETGIQVLLKEAWERYCQPIAVTEVHLHCHREEQLRWFKYIWDSCVDLKKKDHINIVGVTAWALFGSYGWNKLLTTPDGNYEAGVYDLRGGVPRPTALTSFIKQLATKNKCTHFLSAGPGWWKREDRYINEPIIPKAMQSESHLKIPPLLIIGKRGTLGRAFAKVCEKRNLSYIISGREECDITNLASIEKAIDLYKPWAIINAAGFVRVDEAETEAEQCFKENKTGAVNLAIACQRKGIKLLTYSTDLVFDGAKNNPYVESDEVSPLNVYGKSKAEAEKEVSLINPSSLIIRTSAFFSPWDEYNFLHWVETNLNNHQPCPVANDVCISPTYVPDLVHASLDLLIDEEKGISHLANAGSTTWAELAYETAYAFEYDTNFIHSVPLTELNLQAPRPGYSVLSSEKGFLLPSLENALQRYFAEKRQSVHF